MKLIVSSVSGEPIYEQIKDQIRAAVLSGELAAGEALPSLLFLFSPALYALLQGLTQWKEGMSHTMEWKQACRISLPTLTAWRMLPASGSCPSSA